MATSSWADGAVDELIATSGGDRTTLDAFEAAHNGETPTNGTNCQARCKGAIGGGGTTWSGWQAGQNATTRVIVTAETGSETDGTDGSGDAAIITEQGFFPAGAFFIDFTGIEWSARCRNEFRGGGQLRLAKCYFRNFDLSALIIQSVTGLMTVKVGTCLFKAVGVSGSEAMVKCNDSIGPVEIFNCTGYGCDSGFYGQQGQLIIKNSVHAGKLTGSDFRNVSDGDKTYCASGDTTASGANSIINLTAADAWTLPATDNTGDFSLKAGSDLIGAGVAIVDAWFTELCPTDLAGNAWAGTPSIGCFESAAEGIPMAVYQQHRRRG